MIYVKLFNDIQEKLNESFSLLKDENTDVQFGFLLCMNVFSSYLISKINKGELNEKI